MALSMGIAAVGHGIIHRDCSCWPQAAGCRHRRALGCRPPAGSTAPCPRRSGAGRSPRRPPRPPGPHRISAMTCVHGRTSGGCRGGREVGLHPCGSRPLQHPLKRPFGDHRRGGKWGIVARGESWLTAAVPGDTPGCSCTWAVEPSDLPIRRGNKRVGWMERSEWRGCVARRGGG